MANYISDGNNLSVELDSAGENLQFGKRLKFRAETKKNQCRT